MKKKECIYTTLGIIFIYIVNSFIVLLICKKFDLVFSKRLLVSNSMTIFGLLIIICTIFEMLIYRRNTNIKKYEE